MLIKCKTKSPRVKGLAFHPSLNFLLASLHNGDIELWNYVNNMLVDVFKQHEGPARALDFHLVQPLFVSGGDDTTLVVWDFKQKKKLFVLTGHGDYVRFAQFHHKYPWIISSSDDNTIRIWNWQSRDCVTVLPGHNHYVMCAQFCLHSDLIVSASLDHTARIWDFKALREKKCSLGAIKGDHAAKLFTSVQLFRDEDSRHNSISNADGTDSLGFTDVYCKYTLQGHSKGVNWAIFHERQPIVITAGDDKTVRVWRFNSSRAWQTNILRGHEHNVCSLITHPNNINYVLSVSEDNSIRVWDSSKWKLSHSFTMDNDRVWIIAKARNSNYIAAGHDSGLIVFKLFKERPIVAIARNRLYYVWNNVIYVSDVETEVSRNPSDDETATPSSTVLNRFDDDTHAGGYDLNPNAGDSDGEEYQIDIRFENGFQEIVITTSPKAKATANLVFPSPCGEYIKKRTVLGYLRGVSEADLVQGAVSGRNKSRGSLEPKQILVNSYNSDQLVLLVTYKCQVGNFFEILTRLGTSGLQSNVCAGKSGAFGTKNWIVSVDDSKDAFIYNLFGEVVFKLDVEAKVDAVFEICLNQVLFWSEEDKSIFLYDVLERRILTKAYCPFAKLNNVLLCKSKRLIATVFQGDICIFDRELKRVAFTSHHTSIKSAAWWDNVAFLFASTNHIYYILVNGDVGVLSSIVKPLYILGSLQSNYLYYMERDHRCSKVKLESPEFLFKCALYHNNLELANKLISSGLVHGRALVSYLVSKGHAEMARKIVKDPKTRFDLALRFGDLEGALQDAQVIDTATTWLKFGEAALGLGNVVYAEHGFQKAKQFDKLSLLYLVTGNTNRLKKMQNIAKFCNNAIVVIQHCLYLGDMETLAETLKEHVNEDLARVCRKTYGIADADDSDDYKGKGVEGGVDDARYMVPPQPILRLEGSDLNWPVEQPEYSATSLYGASHGYEHLHAADDDGEGDDLLQTHDEADDLGGNKHGDDDDDYDAFADLTPRDDNNLLDFTAKRRDSFGHVTGHADGFDEDDDDDDDDKFGKVVGGRDVGRKGATVAAAATSGVWDSIADDELVLSDHQETPRLVPGSAASPSLGFANLSLQEKILARNHTALNFAAAGEFEKAIDLLKSLYGFCNVAAIKETLAQVYQSSRAHAQIAPNLDPLTIVLYGQYTANPNATAAKPIFNTHITLESASHIIDEGFSQVTLGNFAQAMQEFKRALVHLIFLQHEHPRETADPIKQCSVYILAMLLEAKRQELVDTDLRRSLELAAYFGCCNLQNQHRYLVLRRTMGIMWKAQNYATTAMLVQQLLKQDVSNIEGAKEEMTKAQRIYTLCEQKKIETHDIDLVPQDLEHLEICTVSFTRLRSQAGSVKCNFCKSVALPQFRGETCNVCTLCQLS